MTEAIYGCRPNLLVRNLNTTIRFYTDKLGFRIGWRWSDPEARFLDENERDARDERGTALIARDKAHIILTQSVGEHATWLHFDVHSAAQVDELFEEWRGRGAVIAEPPFLRPWGMYEMRLRDPDGNVLRMSAHQD